MTSMHHSAGGAHYGSDSYEDVIRRSENLFNKIRYSVAQQVRPRSPRSCDSCPQLDISLRAQLRLLTCPPWQTAPTTLKAAFLDPVKERMSLDVLVDVFSRSDADFMGMFTGIHNVFL